MTPYGCPDTAALAGRDGGGDEMKTETRNEMWGKDGYRKNVSYLSVEGSTAGGGSLRWCQGHPAPAAPTGRSAAPWVCTPRKTKTHNLSLFAAAYAQCTFTVRYTS